MRKVLSAILVMACISAHSQCTETPLITTTGGSCFGTASLNLNGVASPSEITWYKNNLPFLKLKATYAPYGTVAGGNGVGSADNQLNYPTSVFIDKLGNIYVADGENNRIQKFPPGGGSGITVAGGNGIGADLNQITYPKGVCVDVNGNIYISDNNNHRVLKWAPGATSGTVVAGGNGQGDSLHQLHYPYGICLDNSGNLYIADNGNHRIIKWVPGADTGVVVAGGNGAGDSANQLNSPNDVKVDSAGNIFIADMGNNRIQMWITGASSGSTRAGTSLPGNAADQLWFPNSLDIDKMGNLIICDALNHRIQLWAPGASEGETIAGGHGNGADSNQLAFPNGVTIDSLGNILICDNVNSRIQKWSPEISKQINAPDVPGAGRYTAGIVSFTGCSYTAAESKIFPSGTPNAILESNAYNDICSGDSVKFACYLISKGADESYHWKRRNTDINGADTAFLITNDISDNDYFSCKIIFNSNGCLSSDTLILISDTIKVGHTYTFTGNGNWDDAANWLNNTPPPIVLERCSKIVVDPEPNGECILNRPQILSKGAVLEVKPGKQFTVKGNLSIADSLAANIFDQYATDTTARGTGFIKATAAELEEIPTVETMDVSQIPQLSRPTTLPIKHILSMPPVGDQGNLNSCVAWATVYGLFSFIHNKIENNVNPDGSPDYTLADKTFSPVFVYNQINDGENKGVGINKGLKYLKNNGSCKWVDMPDFLNYTSQPSQDAIRNAEAYRISTFNYRRFATLDIERIKSLLVSPGIPIPFGCRIDNSFKTCTGSSIVPTADGRYVWHDYSDWARLGHAMLICGYDDSIRAFKVMNSWGENKANEGYYWISYKFFKKMVTKDEFLVTSFNPEIYFAYTSKPNISIVNSHTQEITTQSVVTGGSITNYSNATITESGICYSQNINPTTASTLSSNRSIIAPFTGTDSFAVNLTGLTPNTLYYYRAYAKTSQGIVYSEPKSFRTLLQPIGPDSIFTDPRDGQQYTYRRIGTQVWMTKNLNYAAPGSLCYDNNPANCAIYGRLYNWNTARTVPPPGWHLPSDSEWQILAYYLGDGIVAGGAMKSTSSLWQNPNQDATNRSGWSGLPGGGYEFIGGNRLFFSIGKWGYWWGSFWNGPYARAYFLFYNSGSLSSNYLFQYEGCYVRCVKD